MSTIEIPKPHSKEQRLIMEAWFLNDILEVWCPCGTKFGKTLAASCGWTGRAATRRASLFRWVAPIYSQAKIGFKYAKMIMPPDVDINKGEPSITLQNDSRLEFKSGKFPEDLEGEAVHGGYVLDECAKMMEQVYDSAKTTVTVTRAPIHAYSTPKGKNWFYRKCMDAKEEMNHALKQGKPPKKLFMTAPSAVNPYVTAEAVEDARKSLPDRLFRQYYLAEFIDDGSVFVGFRQCIKNPDITVDDSLFWFADNVENMEVVIGVDWAKHSDFTVMTALKYSQDIIEPGMNVKTERSEKPELVGYVRFQGQTYTDAVKELVRFSNKFKKCGIIYHDRTGVGDAIEDLMSKTHLNFHGVVFTNSSKSAMVNHLIMTFERRGMIIPNWSELLKELDSFEVVTNATGTMRYEAASGSHDDIVCSLMLSHSAYQEYSGDTQINFLEELPSKVLSVDKFYSDLIEDNDDIDPAIGLFGKRY